AIVTNGQVTGYIITNSGVGYSASAAQPLSVLFTTRDANGNDVPPSQATAVATITNNQVDFNKTVIITGGSGYTTAPQVSISAPPTGGQQATATAIVAGGQVIGFAPPPTGFFPGSGYTSAPTIIIAPPPAPVMGMTITGGGTVTLPNANPTLTGT